MNVLVISDLHEPFAHKKALQHCKDTFKKYKCNKVVFLGDIIDNASTTHFDTNPDGMSPLDELNAAREALKPWYKAFPKATVCIGNHEQRILKKLKHAGVTQEWFKAFNEVLQVPNWEFVSEVIIDDVRYFHGEGCASTIQSIYQSPRSIVFGHFHSRFELLFNNGKFGICAGWLADQEAYAFDYAKATIKKGILGCAVVLDNGTQPILVPLLTKD